MIDRSATDCSLNEHWLADRFPRMSPTPQTSVQQSLLCLPVVAWATHRRLCFSTQTASVSLASCFLANLNSLILDYVARQKIGGMHLNFFVLEAAPRSLPPSYLRRSRHCLHRFRASWNWSTPPGTWRRSRRPVGRCRRSAPGEAGRTARAWLERHGRPPLGAARLGRSATLALSPFAPAKWDDDRRAHPARRARRLLRPALRPDAATSCATSSTPRTSTAPTSPARRSGC